VGERYGERKIYQGREKGKEGQLAVQGDRERKDGRANGAERERQKKQQEEAEHKDSKRKKERDRNLDREKKGAGTQQKTQSRAQKDRSGQQQDGDVGKTLDGQQDKEE